MKRLIIDVLFWLAVLYVKGVLLLFVLAAFCLPLIIPLLLIRCAP